MRARVFLTLLFRPEVINAQRRRVFGSVTLHQPARLVALTAVAVIGMAIGTIYLMLGQFARKETVAGWVSPEAGLSAVYAARGGAVGGVIGYGVGAGAQRRFAEYSAGTG
jgi:membrane fusion protein